MLVDGVKTCSDDRVVQWSRLLLPNNLITECFHVCGSARWYNSSWSVCEVVPGYSHCGTGIQTKRAICVSVGGKDVRAADALLQFPLIMCGRCFCFLCSHLHFYLPTLLLWPPSTPCVCRLSEKPWQPLNHPLALSSLSLSLSFFFLLFLICCSFFLFILLFSFCYF